MQDIAEWTDGERPQQANFKTWTDLICDTGLAGPSQKSRRHLLKTMLTEAWTFSNWLTHEHSATWHDAEAAQSTVAHVVGHRLSMVLRHVRSVCEMCPQCGGRDLVPEEGVLDKLPHVIWERPVCEDCG